MQERRLGKGLDVLFASEAVAEQNVQKIAPGRIRPNPVQPRRIFNEEKYDELRSSIARDGILQPVLVREVNGDYELIAGERRWRAAMDLGFESIPAFVRNFEEDRRLELALVENLQRADLNPIEIATAYRALQESLQITQEEIAERVGKNRSTVANALRLLDLPQEIRDDVSRGTLSQGHARAILSVKGEFAQRQVAKRVVKKLLSVRETERLVARLETRAGSRRSVPDRRDPVIREWEETLQTRLGTKVRIQTAKRKGRGRINIEFFDPNEFERIVGLLGVA
ncbi:MAG: ParB/RepB/Spo0J family partition protein [Planctomycetota bacterium]|nr:ParB/RepB/Spo0J family partition protein [Planctomycetota bacterium]